MTNKEALQILEKRKIKHEDDDTLVNALSRGIEALKYIIFLDKIYDKEEENEVRK